MASGALLRPQEAADRLQVTVRTLARWSDEGLIPCAKTPKGHRRYREEDIAQILSNETFTEDDNHGQKHNLDRSDT